MCKSCKDLLKNIHFEKCSSVQIKLRNTVFAEVFFGLYSIAPSSVRLKPPAKADIGIELFSARCSGSKEKLGFS